MNVKSWAFAALATSIVIGATGCGSSQAPPAPRTPIPSEAPAPTSSAPAPSSAGDRPTEPQAAPKPAPNKPPASGPVGNPQPPADQAPYGSGNGLCFAAESELARSAVARLTSPPYPDTPWRILQASNHPIAAGCAGVLSWLLVDWNGSHPGYHVLFFTDGTYLGTATAKYYGYTTVHPQSTKNRVAIEYRWAKTQDALCCPTGGPNWVTFTLTGATVKAEGQFPPDPDK